MSNLRSFLRRWNDSSRATLVQASLCEASFGDIRWPATITRQITTIKSVRSKCRPTFPSQIHYFSATTQNDRQKELDEMLAEASYLTRSLYRNCLRSARVIRYGNEHDEEQFQQQEERQQQQRASIRENRDPRMSFISMLPPVDREDELGSRFEYYQEYTRENFFQSSDCLKDVSMEGISDSNSLLAQQHLRLLEKNWKEYFHLLETGEQNRQWLLGDMKFDDPYEDSYDEDRIEKLRERAAAFVESVMQGGDSSDSDSDSDEENSSDEEGDGDLNDEEDSDSDSDDEED